MNKRNLLLGAVGLLILWVLVFIGTSFLLNEADETQVVALPTQRPTRDDVPELRAPSETPSPEAVPTEEPSITPEATQEATEEPTQEPTKKPTLQPTPMFTLSSLEIARFQREQQENFEEEWLKNAQATVEIPKEESNGAYPIRLAVEELGILSSVLVVQTDPNFDIVTPRDEVGYYALSPKIGAGGNSVMVGHVYPGRVFNKLLDAKVGQIVRVTDEFYEEHYYRIEEVIRFPYEVGNEEDRELGFQYMYDDSEERITLVTCYPEFEWTHRFVVRAVPITAEEAERVQAEDDNS